MKKGTEKTCMKISLLGLCFLIVSVLGAAAPQKQGNPPTMISVFALLTITVGNTAPEAEWPQWRGPLRNGLSSETGLLKQWPDKGPAVTWSITNLGEGYGSAALKADRIYVQGTSGTASEAKSAVFCLNRADGKTIWSVTLGPKIDHDRGNGPRGTPTLDGDRLYVLTENGDLACLRERDGSRVWSKNILKEFGGSNPKWLISESPLVDGNRLIVSPGGSGAGHCVAGQNDRRRDLARERAERPGGLCLLHRGGRGRRAQLHQLHCERGGRRARQRWQADVALPQRRQSRRQCRDADLCRQQSLLFFSLRHGRGIAQPDGAERRGQSAGSLLHARDDEPPRRNGHGQWLSLRLLQLNPDLPGVQHGQGNVERSQRRQRLNQLRGRDVVSARRETTGRVGRSQSQCLCRERALPDQ